MQPDIDENPAEPAPLASGLDLRDANLRYDPWVTCEICGRRWKPLPQNRPKAHVCSNACAMKAKKRRKKYGPTRELWPMPHKPWEKVRTKEQRCTTSPPATTN